MTFVSRVSLVLCTLFLAACGGGGGGGGGGSEAPPAVSVTLTADADFQEQDGQATLTWSTREASSCTASNGWTGSRPLQGTETTAPLTVTTTFVLTCSGTRGTATAKATVGVAGYRAPYPFVDLKHTSFVHDATRNVLYVAMASVDENHPGEIAVVDLATRAVAYSGPLDFTPSSLTVSADGRFLYAASGPTFEVVRMTLPGFAVDLRVPLGPFDSLPPHARPHRDFAPGTVAVSADDPETFAVSLVSNNYRTCAEGVRLYRNQAMRAQFYGSVGDVLHLDDAARRLTTVCSGVIPQTVTRLAFDGASLAVLDSGRGNSGLSGVISVNGDTILAGGGDKFELPAFTFRGSLSPLAGFPDEPPNLLEACTFSRPSAPAAVCLSQTEEWPAYRSLVVYSLETATPFHAVRLDMRTVRGFSRVVRTGPGRFAVSVGRLARSDIPQSYHPLVTRIYLLRGVPERP